MNLRKKTAAQLQKLYRRSARSDQAKNQIMRHMLARTHGFFKGRLKAVATMLLVSFLALGAGCGTVTPVKVRDTVASYDGNDRNSGLLKLLKGGGSVMTPHAIERYNGLIERYGKLWTPKLAKNYGVTQCPCENFIMSDEALIKFATMNRWNKEGRQP